jgi:hypothetical protein
MLQNIKDNEPNNSIIPGRKEHAEHTGMTGSSSLFILTLNARRPTLDA